MIALCYLPKTLNATLKALDGCAASYAVIESALYSMAFYFKQQILLLKRQWKRQEAV